MSDDKEFWVVEMPNKKHSTPLVRIAVEHELTRSIRTNWEEGIEVYGSYASAERRASEWGRFKVSR